MLSYTILTIFLDSSGFNGPRVAHHTTEWFETQEACEAALVVTLDEDEVMSRDVIGLVTKFNGGNFYGYRRCSPLFRQS